MVPPTSLMKPVVYDGFLAYQRKKEREEGGRGHSHIITAVVSSEHNSAFGSDDYGGMEKDCDRVNRAYESANAYDVARRREEARRNYDPGPASRGNRVPESVAEIIEAQRKQNILEKAREREAARWGYDPGLAAKGSFIPRHPRPSLIGDGIGNKQKQSATEQPERPAEGNPTNDGRRKVNAKVPPRQMSPSPVPSTDADSESKPRRKAPLPTFNKNPKQTDSGRKKRYVPRPGDEELAAAVEMDRTDPEQIKVTFDDVAGQHLAKQMLEEAVVYPVQMPEFFTGIRRPWKGVLLYGPPGTGKTMLAKAVAGLSGTTFFNISPATLTSRLRGDSEKLVRILFEMARHYAPSVIFIDEIDALTGARGGTGEHEASRRALSTLLMQMDGVGVDGDKCVVVLGATNHPWDIDEAMRRRLEKRIYIPLPDRADRVELFRLNTRDITLAPDVDFDKLSGMLEGRYYSAADLTTLCRDAALRVLRRLMGNEEVRREYQGRMKELQERAKEDPVSLQDFRDAMQSMASSISPDQLKRFDQWRRDFEAK